MRIHGRHGIVYMSLFSTMAASPVAFLSDWEIDFPVTTTETTGQLSVNKEYTTGVPDCSGSFAGFYDDSSTQFYQAVRDGLPRNFYLYPDTVNDPFQYWYGSVLPTVQIAGGTGAAVGIKGDWRPNSQILQVIPAPPPSGLATLSGTGTLTAGPSAPGAILDEAGAGLLDQSRAFILEE